MLPKQSYTKLPLSADDIISMLKCRGLIIDDEALVRRHLQIISYFRLAAYFRPMEVSKETHRFKPGSKFENAVALYYFDKELRALIFTAIQSVEIAIRAAVIENVSEKYGSFWFADPSHFSDHEIFAKCMANICKETARSKEEFIIEHLAKYDTPPFPPVWKSLEVVSFGTLAKLYCNLSDIKLKKQIAHSLGLPQHIYLESWIKSLTALRNYIAHHNRIWNRRFPVKPQLPTALNSPWIKPSGDPYWLYSPLSCLIFLENTIHPGNTFILQFKTLLAKYPMVDPSAMGFPIDWQNETLWK